MAGVACGRGRVWPGSRVAGVACGRGRVWPGSAWRFVQPGVRASCVAGVSCASVFCASGV